MLLSFFYLLCEKCQVFERRMKDKKAVCKCECEVWRNIVFEHIKEHLKGGRDRVDILLGR